MTWISLFSDVIDGRSVELQRYSPSGELRVKTTQAETETTSGYIDGNNTVFPSVIPQGAPIEIEADTPDKLVLELCASGFTEEDAKKIAGHAV